VRTIVTRPLRKGAFVVDLEATEICFKRYSFRHARLRLIFATIALDVVDGIVIDAVVIAF